jgi:hypothetical protein
MNGGPSGDPQAQCCARRAVPEATGRSVAIGGMFAELRRRLAANRLVIDRQAQQRQSARPVQLLGGDEQAALRHHRQCVKLQGRAQLRISGRVPSSRVVTHRSKA